MFEGKINKICYGTGASGERQRSLENNLKSFLLSKRTGKVALFWEQQDWQVWSREKRWELRVSTEFEAKILRCKRGFPGVQGKRDSWES